MRTLSGRFFSFVITALFLLAAFPACAHDLPVGASWWAVGSKTIVARIELKSAVVAEMKPVKEGRYNLDSIPDAQIRQVATGLFQAYIDDRLSVTVDDKTYPLKISKIARNENGIYTIWLSADNIRFERPENPVRIAYSLLFEEDNEHVNLASGYLTDATGDDLEKIFDFHRPQFRTTFDSKARTWELSVKGPANAPAEEQITGSAAARGSLDGIKNPAAQESTANNRAPTAPIPDGTSNKQHSNAGSAVSSMPSVREFPSAGDANRSIAQDTPKGYVWATVCQFVPLGVEHILTGYDHIAFLLAIIVIGLSIREVLRIITAFTIAHSITLLLAAMEIIRLNSRFVESVIAFSICYVALENVFKKKVNYRWLITFGFGLIHGFGFASALQELIVGKSSLLLSVVSFNAGVECGQLAVFFVMLPILYMLRRLIEFRVVTVSTSVCIFMIGFTWLIERLFHLKLLWF